MTQVKHAKEDMTEVNLLRIIEASLKKLSYMKYFDCLQVIKSLDFESILFSEEAQVKLIVENLLSNAIKYQDLQKQNSFVEIETKSQDGRCVLMIKNNGIGIPEHQQPHLFKMFRRFHPKLSFGSGLGLYMIKRSVDRIQGEIIYTDTKDGMQFAVLF